MNRKFLYVMWGVIALLGAFMPLASLGQFYVNVHHLSGLPFLLYLLPLGIVALGILNIYKSHVKYLRAWLISLAIIGLIITGLATLTGMGYLNYMAQEQTRFDRLFNFNKEDSKQKEQHAPSAGLGSGGLLLFIGFSGTIVSALLQKTSKTDIHKESIAKVEGQEHNI
ncbi:MAG: hypothetical protein RMJ39_10005 [Deltaproteobacteria bacterium]|nr:hypothetical protein [Deltaproteobacteria bacterium]